MFQRPTAFAPISVLSVESLAVLNSWMPVNEAMSVATPVARFTVTGSTLAPKLTVLKAPPPTTSLTALDRFSVFVPNRLLPRVMVPVVPMSQPAAMVTVLLPSFMVMFVALVMSALAMVNVSS